MRKKIIVLIFGIVIFVSNYFVYAGSLATEDKIGLPAANIENEKSTAPSSDNSKDSLRNSSFVLETDEQSASESLKRISGDIDLGFSAPENSYKSDEKAGAGPFEKEKVEMRKQANHSY